MITLVLGGARSGKSVVAERIAAGLVESGPAGSAAVPAVTYVATLDVGDDADLAARVDEHRRRRPGDWRTVTAGPGPRAAAPHGAGRPGQQGESGGDPARPALTDVLRAVAGVVLVDSLGPWVSATEHMDVDTGALCAALVERDGHSVVVSEEVGLSVHPATESGRRFQDALGALNQAVAACADDVWLVVAGRALRLDPPGPG